MKKNTTSILYYPMMLTGMAFTFLMFFLPIYSKQMGASALEIGGLYSIFTITVLVGRPVVGWAIDRYGRKRFLVAAIIGYALTMFFFSYAGSLPGLYLARFTQGVASSLFWITIRTIITDLSEVTDRGTNMGKLMEANNRGGLIGIFIGFAIYKTISDMGRPDLGWMITFWVYSALAAAGAFIAARNLPETKPHQENINGNGRGIDTRRLIKLLVVVFSTNAAMALLAPIYMIYLQDHFTTKIETLAWAFLPAGIVYSLLPSRLGKLSDRFGRAPLMALGAVIAGILAFMIPHLPSLVWLAVFYTAESIGWSMADPAEQAMVADIIGDESRGKGFGYYEFTAMLGATIGPLAGGWLYDSTGKAVPFYLTSGILFAGAAWVLTFLRSKPHAGRIK